MDCNLAMEEKNANNVIDKSSDKYKVALKFVNKVLTNIDKPTINDLTEFKNIDRNELLSEKITKILEEMEPEIWTHYNKRKCGAYHNSDNRTLNVFRGMIRENNLKICIKKKDITDKSGVNKGFRRTHMLYNIE